MHAKDRRYIGERDRYWTCIYILDHRDFSLAMRCRLVWPTGAYTAAPLVDWRNGNGGQYAQANRVGDNSFCHLLVLFLSRFQVGAGVQL